MSAAIRDRAGSSSSNASAQNRRARTASSSVSASHGASSGDGDVRQQSFNGLYSRGSSGEAVVAPAHGSRRSRAPSNIRQGSSDLRSAAAAAAIEELQRSGQAAAGSRDRSRGEYSSWMAEGGLPSSGSTGKGQTKSALHNEVEGWYQASHTPHGGMQHFLNSPIAVRVPSSRLSQDKHAQLRESLTRDMDSAKVRQGDSGPSPQGVFDEWAMGLEPDDHRGLRKSLEGFLTNSNMSVEKVAEWLSLRQARNKARGGPASVHEGLRSCLQDMMHEQNSGKGFRNWIIDEDCPLSPTSSQGSSDGERDHDPAALGGGAARARGTSLHSLELGAGADAAGFRDVDFESPRRLVRAPSRMVSMQLRQAQSAMAVQLPVEDAAAQEAAGWGSREDADFVTPWYTYVMRVLMFPLGALIFYFIYWCMYNYPRSGIWWADACAWIFIVSEAICFLFGMTHWVWMWSLKFRKRVTQAELGLTDDDLPTVDIMIPCYSEPTEIVEMTLRACYDMDYPAHKLTCWVCDDGKSDDMKRMVELTAAAYTGRVATRYVARVKLPGVPHHAKAGNLNNCILGEGSCGQLIIVLDCDMLPEPCMARTVAPFFFTRPERAGGGGGDVEGGKLKGQFDNTTGLLQTPQAFYNLDTNDLLGQSYAFFYECLMSGWDGAGCTPCCGTGVTFNRHALESVGGFSTGSITEDFKTSLNLCAHGFRCKYFLQRMTRGVSPKELNAFMVQRMRWAVGAIQIVRASNPLFTRGLPLTARWLYFFSTVGIVYIIPVVLMGIIMYSTILAGAPISFGPTSFEQYLAIGGTAVGLMMVMQYLAAWRLSWRDYLRALQDNFTVFMTLIRSILIGFCGMEMGFAVTAKDVSFDLRANLFHAAPHLCVYLFSGCAMTKGVLEMLAHYGLFDIFWTTAAAAASALLLLPLRRRHVALPLTATHSC
eukprot:TRINITY_DN1871_c0_g2_i3.p1 TRINITY_DN1871_c0_g2~~TRINITY_DN1871_c0_g2_i3.p1  ORF type:complete len:935 (-),score=375.26 TRINITY_DN1871_c0_g2_i3:718-3522(-)